MPAKYTAEQFTAARRRNIDAAAWKAYNSSSNFNQAVSKLIRDRPRLTLGQASQLISHQLQARRAAYELSQRDMAASELARRTPTNQYLWGGDWQGNRFRVRVSAFVSGIVSGFTKLYTMFLDYVSPPNFDQIVTDAADKLVNVAEASPSAVLDRENLPQATVQISIDTISKAW